MRLLECRVRLSVTELDGHGVTCPCGRSFGQVRNGVAEIAGPGRALLAVDVLPDAGGRRTLLRGSTRPADPVDPII